MLDLAELSRTFDDACGWITKACGKRLTTEEKLRAALAMRKKMRWRPELNDVLAAAGHGIHSVLEYRYLRDVERAHGLPRSRHQVRVVIDGMVVYRDAYYEEYQLAVELDGRLAHPEDERWRDSQRDNGSPGGRGPICSPRRTSSFSVNARGHVPGSVITACLRLSRAIARTRLAGARSAARTTRLRCETIWIP